MGGLAAATLSGAAGAAATGSEKAHAREALVALSDLPPGWTATPMPSTSAASFGGGSQLARCLGVPAKVIADTPPKVQSPLFRDREGQVLVQDSVSIYPSADFARKVLAALSNRKAARCIGAALNAASPGSASSGRIAVTRLAAPRGTVALALDQSVTTGRVTTPTSTEAVYFFKGRYGNGLDVETTGTRPPVSLADRLLRAARARL